MSCQIYTQCFILEPVLVSYVVPSIHPVFYTETSACNICHAKYTPSVLKYLYPMSCQVYTQCFILEPVSVSHVVPSIHPVFYTGTSACIPCRAKYTPSVLYWTQCLYPMSYQVYTQCFILEPVPVSYVVPNTHSVFYTEPVPVSYVVPSIHPVFYIRPVPVSCVVPSIHPVFYMKPVPVS